MPEDLQFAAGKYGGSSCWRVQYVAPIDLFGEGSGCVVAWVEALTSAVVGRLIAFYGHIAFTQGIVRGIGSFDQGASWVRSSPWRSPRPSRQTRSR